MDTPTNGELYPGKHLVHVAEEGAPETPEWVPPGQLVQVADRASEYVGGGHITHVEIEVAFVTGEAYPAEQLMHIDELFAPVTLE